MSRLVCESCDKRLTRKGARQIDGKVICGDCMFRPPNPACKDCGKPKGYGGRRGAECMCDLPPYEPGLNPWRGWPGPPK